MPNRRCISDNRHDVEPAPVFSLRRYIDDPPALGEALQRHLKKSGHCENAYAGSNRASQFNTVDVVEAILLAHRSRLDSARSTFAVSQELREELPSFVLDIPTLGPQSPLRSRILARVPHVCPQAATRYFCGRKIHVNHGMLPPGPIDAMPSQREGQGFESPLAPPCDVSGHR
jgi:hypothetical protein